MANRKVLVVRTQTANTASVLAGLRRAGAQPVVTRDPQELLLAPAVVLPGVGAMHPAMRQLQEDGMTGALTDRLRAGRATLAICLGLQLMAAGSEESPGTAGLGILPVTARRFDSAVRIPQLGWNRIEPGAGCRLLRSGHAYFANSYCIEQPPRGWFAAYADHGKRFVAAVEQGNVLGCQFHPELSGAFGLDLMSRWLGAAFGKGGASC